MAIQYAEAVLDLAAQSQLSDAIYEDLKLVTRVINGHPELSLILKHPSIPAEEKRKVVVKLFGGNVQELTIRLLELLLDKRRFYLIDSIQTEYHELLNRRKNIVSASLYCAERLSDSAVADIKARLTEHLGKKLELDVKVDPSLIGGVVLKLGDQVIDGSLKGKLRSMERVLMSV